MAKLLPTRLPVATTEISVDLYNRLIRILELNLGEFDPSNTDQFSTETRNKTIFNAGSIIFNTTINKLQIWNGTAWHDITMTLEVDGSVGGGVEAVASVGTVTVTSNKTTTSVFV
tara:strand:- start:741 stop:1085 length:345 start_codon:yes stop_codon:yes gene_type:complete